MRMIRAGWSSIRALCLTLALALAPVAEALHHGPALVGVETDAHSHDGHHHSDGQQDSSDHDHLSVVVLAGDGAEVHPLPARRMLAGPVRANGSPPDNPRRPPRPMML